jgi:hypothetical protein
VSAKKRAYRVSQRLVRRAGFHLTRARYYSPIPTNVPDGIWSSRSPLRGLEFDFARQLEWLSRHVAPFTGEFCPPIQVTPEYAFDYNNGSFGHVDADVLYGIVRSTKPSRVVELGSGHTSVVIHLALTENRKEKSDCIYQVFDPYPTNHLLGTAGAFTIDQVGAESVAEDTFTSLSAGDILFVDTTHTVKIGGDVVKIVLDALPLLVPGVLIHFHDIFLPYEYPKAFIDEQEFFWGEQYLLQAFLAFNEQFRVEAALHALFRERRCSLLRLLPSTIEGSPGSLWISRC